MAKPALKRPIHSEPKKTPLEKRGLAIPTGNTVEVAPGVRNKTYKLSQRGRVRLENLRWKFPPERLWRAQKRLELQRSERYSHYPQDIIEKLKNLYSEDYRDQQKGIKELNRPSDSIAVSHLLEMLKRTKSILGMGRDKMTREQAQGFDHRKLIFRSLAGIGNRRAVPPMINELKKQLTTNRIGGYYAGEIFEALYELNDKRVGPVMHAHALRHAQMADVDGKSTVFKCLGRIGYAIALPDMITLLKDKNPKLQRYGKLAVEGEYDLDAVPHLADGLKGLRWENTDHQPIILPIVRALYKIAERYPEGFSKEQLERLQRHPGMQKQLPEKT